MIGYPASSQTSGILARTATALTLAFCLAAGARAQQDQQQDQPPPSQDQPTPTPPPAKPAYASQDADKPPYSRDSKPQTTLLDKAAPEASSQPIPGTLTIPAGTVILLRINDFLSSDRNKIGDQFTAVLDQPIVVNGWVVARRGQTLIGQVKFAQKAGRIKGVSQLGIEITDLTLVDGRQVPVLTELWKASAGTSHGQDAATIGTTTGLGALIGAAADWGRGAAIGAGAGAAVGIGAVLLTRGHPTELAPETPLSFRLSDPVRVDTTQSQQAFQPVNQRDFDGGHLERRGPPRVASGYYGPYPCGYYGPCYAYPGYVGFYYSDWGWGPGFYGRRGFRR